MTKRSPFRYFKTSPEVIRLSRTADTGSRLHGNFVAGQKAAAQKMEMPTEFCDLFGCASAVVRHPDGLVEAASGPRSHGAALSF